MECSRARESLSALLDDEDPDDDPAAVQSHLNGCAECAEWQSDASQLDRRLRLTPAPAPAETDLAAQVLAAVRLPRPRRWPMLARAALVVVALVQLGIAAANLVGPFGLHTSMSPSPHMGHEVTAFNLAFGVALFVIAHNPRRATGQVPVLASFLLVLAAASAVDLGSGAVGWARLATHTPIVVGLLLAAALTRAPATPPEPGNTPATNRATESARFPSFEPGMAAEPPQATDIGPATPPVSSTKSTPVKPPWRRSA